MQVSHQRRRDIEQPLAPGTLAPAFVVSALLMQPLSARCMHVLLRFQMGAHSLPGVLGRRTGTTRCPALMSAV